jgi:hypothetical protein
MKLVKNFLGRAPNQKAFLEEVKKKLESDFDIKKIAISNFESYKAFKLNDIKVSPAIMVTKPLLKISQFINKKIA